MEQCRIEEQYADIFTRVTILFEQQCVNLGVENKEGEIPLMELKVELTRHDSLSQQRREAIANPSNLRGNVEIINLMEVGSMRGPVLWSQSLANHVNIPSLMAHLAFCLFNSAMMSPHTQSSTNAMR